MLKFPVVMAAVAVMSAPVAAQTAPQSNADAAQTAPPQPGQPQMVKKCRRVPDYPSSGTMLGPTHQECKMVPAKGHGSTAGQPTGDNSAAGNK
jgi:hypothetical protein